MFKRQVMGVAGWLIDMVDPLKNPIVCENCGVVKKFHRAKDMKEFIPTRNFSPDIAYQRQYVAMNKALNATTIHENSIPYTIAWDIKHGVDGTTVKL